MAVAANIIALWPSTNASIPSGWSRETALDGKYIQGAAAGADADLSTSRGAATHTHTSPSHTPTQNAHVHYIMDGGDDGSTLVAGSGSPSVQLAPMGHMHVDVLGDSGFAFASQSVTATNTGVAITVSANTSNDLAYVKVIFIKSDGSPTGVPNGGYGFFVSDTLPASWTRVQGDKYLKGADAAGDGGATGGSNTHTHTDNGGAGHTHGQNNHTHTGNSPGVDFVISKKNVAGTNYARATHRHSVTGTGAGSNQAVVTTINSSNHEPVFKKLNIIANGTGAASLPDQLVLLWGGTNAGIPTDWARVTGMDGNFIKGANADGESNVTTGGATTHTHTASNCQPTQNAHSHSWSDGGATTVISSSGAGSSISAASHHHFWSEDTNGGTYAIPTNNAVAVTIDANTAESAYPSHFRVIFIKYTTPAAPSGMDHLMMMGVS